MRRFCLLVALIIGCASAPEAPPPPSAWWEGVWVVDQARLLNDARAAGLDADALKVAHQMIVGVAPDLRVEISDGFLRRQIGGAPTAQPVEIRRGAQGVTLRTPQGKTSHMRRDAGGVRLDDLPLRRP
jgi:hypothetical protein